MGDRYNQSLNKFKPNRSNTAKTSRSIIKDVAECFNIGISKPSTIKINHGINLSQADLTLLRLCTLSLIMLLDTLTLETSKPFTYM